MRVIYPSVGIRVSYSLNFTCVPNPGYFFPVSGLIPLFSSFSPSYLSPLPPLLFPLSSSCSPRLYIFPPPASFQNFSPFFPLFSSNPVLYLNFILAYSPHSHNHCTYYMDHHPFWCHGLPSKAIKE